MTKSSAETGSAAPASDSAPRSDEPTTSSQRERRRRILDATLALAAKGGYEAVQMRAVAEKAEVAVGTLYRYFPSKVHLLVSALAREFRRLDQRTERSAPPGDTAQERMKVVVEMITKSMQRDPNLTEAMTRAFMFADASVANEVEEVGFYMDRILGMDVDVLVPAAVSYAITAANCGEVTAPIVVEAANAATTADAELDLTARGIAVLPDFIANAGAVAWAWWLILGEVDDQPENSFLRLGREMTAKVADLLTDWDPAGGPVRWAADISGAVRTVPPVVVP